MDENLNVNQLPSQEPKPVSPNGEKNGLLEELEFGVGGVMIGIGTFLLMLFVLNYFNIVSLSLVFPNQLSWLPHRSISKPPASQGLALQGNQSQSASPTPIQSGPTPTPPPVKITLSCPVPKEFCKLGKQITFNSNPALAYSLPEGTQIRSIAPVTDSQQFVTQPYRKENPIGLYQSYISNSDCYTASYTLSSNSVIPKIDLLPLEQGTPLATISANLIPNSGEEGNFILQLQKRPLDKTTLGKPDDQRCPIVNLQPKDFGQYQEIDISLFE